MKGVNSPTILNDTKAKQTRVRPNSLAQIKMILNSSVTVSYFY